MGQKEAAAAQIKTVLPQFFTTSVTRTPVTKTINNTDGGQILTEGTPVTILVDFFKRDQIRNMEKWGQMIENADALMLTLYNTTINVDDKITFGTEVFRVDAQVLRYSASIHVYTVNKLFRIA